MLWLLTLLDLFVLIIATITHFNILVSLTLIILSSGYLIIKGVAFFGEGMSFIDLGVAVYLLLMLIGVRTFVYYIIMAWFLYKLIFSFIR